jgi:hypothetical protein
MSLSRTILDRERWQIRVHVLTFSGYLTEMVLDHNVTLSKETLVL